MQGDERDPAPTTRDRVRRLVQRVAPEIEITPPELGGPRLVVPRGADALMAEGYEPKVIAALRRLVRRGDVCADVGANVGFYTLLLSSLAGPSGRVVAFEPREDTAALLARNLALNDRLGVVEIQRAAVTDGATATVELYSGDVGSEMRSTILSDFAEREPTDGRRVVTVRAVALDDCFGPGERLDVVKLDIEGAEAVAALGMRRVLTEQRPALVVEFHHDVGWPVIRHLRAAGYRFERFDGTPLATPAAPADVPGYFVALPAQTDAQGSLNASSPE